ncbi:hypothetical protein [Ferruginivarius sediminum]|uniref:Uncharacterized protein n=1 Tax=Ferruginivarius sediminum TaxID=2661937 RepID=A0A369T826_9PROT|nr:hypothetical protein [Ferruginivarius sediminum]RDD61460.1 hypothetical protein DRB17_13375 [Ferruginivarius sediminum]
MHISLSDTTTEYAALLEKDAELSDMEKRLDQERDQIAADLRRQEIHSEQEWRTKVGSRQRRPADDRAAELLNGYASPKVDAEPDNPFPRLIEIDDEIRACRQARRQLRDKIEQERLVASDEICRQVKPEHDRLRDKAAKALAEAIRAYDAYGDFKAQLRNANVSFGQLGVLNADTSAIRRELARHIRDGNLNRNIVKGIKT